MALGTPVVAADRRRNGSKASCEPCRQCKVRCDHLRPICGSCERRGRGAQCWYHPAPLTKKKPSTPTHPVQPVQPVIAGSRSQARPRSQGSGVEPILRVNGSPLGNASVNASTPLEGRLLTSANAESGREHLPEVRHIASQPRQFRPLTADSGTEHLPELRHVASQLRHFQSIKTLLSSLFSTYQVCLVPEPLVRQLVASIENCSTCSPHIENTSAGGSLGDLSSISERLLSNAAREVDIDPSLNLEGFCGLFCGSNLRVELLGVVFAIAARVMYMSDRQARKGGGVFQQLAEGSSLALRLARDICSQSNDLLVWLAYENLLLTALVEGDASIKVWRKLGNLATDLYILGLQLEENYSPSKIPFFLAECRRKVFAMANHADKALAWRFGAPRISIRHADCRPPADIPDHVLFSAQPDSSQYHLAPDGWNTDEKHRTTTWARVRYVISRYREELFDYSFSSRQVSNKSQLRDLLERFNIAWDSLPAHLKYSQHCWTSGLSSDVCVMLGKVYLLFLHTKLQILKLLDEGTETHSSEALTAAVAMVETVVKVCSARDMSDLHFRDLPGMILMYGLPGASVLTSALQSNSARQMAAFPPTTKRAHIIRNLSVLVSLMETAASPEDANHPFCVQASRAVANVLDSILDSNPDTAGGRIDSSRPSTMVSQPVTSDAGNLTSMEPANPEFASFDEMGIFELDNWAMNVDFFGAVNSQWNIF